MSETAVRTLFLDPPAAPAVADLALERRDSSRLILIAERDRGVRDLQEHFLREAGFSVEFVDDGEAALELALARRPLLVITEILIPKLDGLTLCRRIRAEPTMHDTPVIVFSILAASARAGEAGAQAFLRKPLVGSTFVAAVQDVIGATIADEVEER